MCERVGLLSTAKTSWVTDSALPRAPPGELPLTQSITLSVCPCNMQSGNELVYCRNGHGVDIEPVRRRAPGESDFRLGRVPAWRNGAIQSWLGILIVIRTRLILMDGLFDRMITAINTAVKPTVRLHISIGHTFRRVSASSIVSQADLWAFHIH